MVSWPPPRHSTGASTSPWPTVTKLQPCSLKECPAHSAKFHRMEGVSSRPGQAMSLSGRWFTISWDYAQMPQNVGFASLPVFPSHGVVHVYITCLYSPPV